MVIIYQQCRFYADSLKMPNKINEGQKRAFCYRFLFHQMAPIVDADAKSF